MSLTGASISVYLQETKETSDSFRLHYKLTPSPSVIYPGFQSKYGNQLSWLEGPLIQGGVRKKKIRRGDVTDKVANMSIV